MGRLKALEQSCLSAVDVTQERLLTLLKENAETEFGKKHEFSEICSVYDYKRKVPFSVFDDYAASVDRMMRGEKHVLTAYPISFYAHTSGTLGKAKNIPGKVIRVQRQRYDQVAQGISQWGSPPIDTTNGLINMVL